jgi:hypothetical protein
MTNSSPKSKTLLLLQMLPYYRHDANHGKDVKKKFVKNEIRYLKHMFKKSMDYLIVWHKEPHFGNRTVSQLETPDFADPHRYGGALNR